MKRLAFSLAARLTAVGIVASGPPASGRDDGGAAPIFGIKIFPGYRDWRLISVAHEEGSLNDIRAILGNDIAIKAYRENKLPFPDGTVIARIAWKDVPSEEKQQRLWPGPSFCGRARPGVVPAVYGQELKKVRRNRWLGVRSI